MPFTTIKGGAVRGIDPHPGAMHVRTSNPEASARRRLSVESELWEGSSPKEPLGEQYVGPRENTKEQRKLQAEEDQVVLLCRD